MKRQLVFLTALSLLLLFLAPALPAQRGAPPDWAPPPPQEPPQTPPEPDPPEKPGRPDESDVATPNLSFPSIHTDIIELFYLKECIDLNNDGVCQEDEWILYLDGNGDPVPIPVPEVIQEAYEGTYPEIDDMFHGEYVLDPETGCPLDLNQDDEPDVTLTPQLDYLLANVPWYPQPKTIVDPDCIGDPNAIWDASCVEAANSWQADWTMLESDYLEPLVYVDFVDWADVLEAIPEWEMGIRVPLSVTLYEKTGDAYEDGGWGETMAAYNTALLEYQGGPDELFGVSTLDGPAGDYTSETYFATVLTNKYFAEVCPPVGPCERTKLVPTMNPNGMVNIKAAGFGFIPEMEGIYRVWIHFNDPLISLSGAVVNDVTNYVLSTGCMADEMDWLKALKTGIVGDSTFVDINVVENRSDDPPPTPKPR